MSPRRNRNAGGYVGQSLTGAVLAICEACKKLFTPRVKGEDEGRVPRWCNRCQPNHGSRRGYRR